MWSAFKRSKNVTNEPTAVQIIHNTEGSPAFVVVPYEHYLAQQNDPNLVPHAVVSRLVDGATPIRAWREHLGISQSAFAQQEVVSKPRRTTREKIAKAFGINAIQLEL